jgi:hypothetical protein
MQTGERLHNYQHNLDFFKIRKIHVQTKIFVIEDKTYLTTNTPMRLHGLLRR